MDLWTYGSMEYLELELQHREYRQQLRVQESSKLLPLLWFIFPIFFMHVLCILGTMYNLNVGEGLFVSFFYC